MNKLNLFCLISMLVVVIMTQQSSAILGDLFNFDFDFDFDLDLDIDISDPFLRRYIILLSLFRPRRHCPGGRVIVECATCDVGCDERESPRECPFSCSRGCACPPGYYVNNTGICVPEAECLPQLPPDPSCGGGRIFTTCGTCPLRCDQRANPPLCTQQCMVGCFCPPGYLINDNEQCVEPEQCPPIVIPTTTARPTPPICTGNRVFTTCGTCEVECGDRNTPQACTLECRIGCFCPPGYFIGLGNICVTSAQCALQEPPPLPPTLPPTQSPTQPPAPSCPGNQFYSTCAGCVFPCSDVGTIQACAAVCRRQCTCPADHYLLGDLCVTADMCPPIEQPTNQQPLPPICPGDLVFFACVGCDITCDLGNPVCPETCRPGCNCPPGYVRSGDNCITPSDCPSTVLPTAIVTTTTVRPTFPPSMCNPSCKNGGRCGRSRYGGYMCYCRRNYRGIDCSDILFDPERRCWPRCTDGRRCTYLGLRFACVLRP